MLPVLYHASITAVLKNVSLLQKELIISPSYLLVGSSVDKLGNIRNIELVYADYSH